jgi:hypothetical protein
MQWEWCAERREKERVDLMSRCDFLDLTRSIKNPSGGGFLDEIYEGL